MNTFIILDRQKMDEDWLEMVMMAFFMGMLNLDQIVAILMILTTREPPTKYKDLPQLNIDNLDDDDCLSMFRFHKVDIYRLQRALQIPDTVTFKNQIKEKAVNA